MKLMSPRAYYLYKAVLHVKAAIRDLFAEHSLAV